MTKKIDKEEGVVEEVVESEAKKRFRVLIEDYKKQNPTKYELKKVALEAELNKMQ